MLGVFANFTPMIMGYPVANMLQKYGYKKTALVAIAVELYRRRHPDAFRHGTEFRRLSPLGASLIAGFSMCVCSIRLSTPC